MAYQVVPGPGKAPRPWEEGRSCRISCRAVLVLFAYSGIVPRLKLLLDLGPEASGLLASSIFFGALLGCACGLLLNDRIGRRATTVVGEVTILAGTVGQLAIVNL